MRPLLTTSLLKDTVSQLVMPLPSSNRAPHANPGPVPSLNRTLRANPTAVPSGIPSPPSTISSSSPAENARFPGSPALVSGPQPASVLPYPTEVVSSQSSEAIEQSPNDTRSPSPTESHYSDAREEIKPPATSQVHRDPGVHLPAHPPQIPTTTTSPGPLTPTPGASSTAVVESPLTPTPTISTPDNPPVTGPTKPEQKPPVSFFTKIRKRMGW